MTIKEIELKKILTESFPEANIKIDDLAGDDNHFALTIISSKFKGMSRIDQHKMVYDALGSKMGNELHALSIKTQIP
ncbi:MAG: BolA family transcriptional regulator [Rhodobiaceae bacterium]|nr:BolA family transcriptional regulator [Rhodobiaceae bacterium]